jgi:predicted class III extradiol MEMO1 family dioxygenase
MAEARKDVLVALPHDRPIILISCREMDDTSISALVTADIALHTWFGTITLDSEKYVGGTTVDSELFAAHALGIEAQLPFIRAYSRHTNVVPYVVNMTVSDIQFEDFLDTMFAWHGEDAIYVFVQPEKDAERCIQRVESR